jgi:hypothetical protein
MKSLPLLLLTGLFSLSCHDLLARGGGGGGGFRGGGDFGGGEFREEGMNEGDAFRDDAPRVDDNAVGDVDVDREGNDVNISRDGNDVNIDRTSQDNFRVNDNNGSADVNVRPDGDGMANVNVRTGDGKDYDTTVAGPNGYRAGYVWQNGDYVAVDCDPFVPYAAPFGAWAGWNIVTQPDYVQYPVYATYPVETAVEVALQKLGLYSGPIDGNATSCAGAIEQYQMQNGMPVTGTITPDLLTALGIQATFQ